MGPTASQVRDIIMGMRSRGLDIGLRDISFAVLSNVYGDETLAFRATFGDAPEVPQDEYLAREKMSTLLTELAPFFPDEQNVISFDELKSGLIDDLRALERLRDATDEDGNSPLDAKEMATVVARIADIRVKLTEKFNTTERVVEQRVVVEQKYNAICACGREIYLPEGARLSAVPNQKDLFDMPVKH